MTTHQFWVEQNTSTAKFTQIVYLWLRPPALRQRTHLDSKTGPCSGNALTDSIFPASATATITRLDQFPARICLSGWVLSVELGKGAPGLRLRRQRLENEAELVDRRGRACIAFGSV